MVKFRTASLYPLKNAVPETPGDRRWHAPKPPEHHPPYTRRWRRWPEPVGHSRPPRTPQRLFFEPDTSTAGSVEEVGGLGTSMLHYQLPHYRHPRRWAQRQARSHHRDVGTPESPRTPRIGPTDGDPF
ncbi:unnamed protein product [Ilex paraguariensis]|uniref:Uncharacterized protein n=1 Tax=Ilex paraguariensis TaxID=185542 RepID=A0ABC8SQY0_9AQUA